MDGHSEELVEERVDTATFTDRLRVVRWRDLTPDAPMPFLDLYPYTIIINYTNYTTLYDVTRRYASITSYLLSIILSFLIGVKRAVSIKRRGKAVERSGSFVSGGGGPEPLPGAPSALRDEMGGKK